MTSGLVNRSVVYRFLTGLLVLFLKAGLALAADQTLQELRESAVAGDIAAIYELGERYYYGQEYQAQNSVEEDYGKAINWYHKAAELGNVAAMHDVGWMYQNGYGVERDFQKAMQWYRRAAQAGNSNSMTQIGWLYQFGLGVERDEEKALKWYRQAADLEDPIARSYVDLLSGRKGTSFTAHFEKIGRIRAGMPIISWGVPLAAGRVTAVNMDTDEGGGDVTIELFSPNQQCPVDSGLVVVSPDRAGEQYIEFSIGAEIKKLSPGGKILMTLNKSDSPEYGSESQPYLAKYAKNGRGFALYSLAELYRNGICVDIDPERAWSLLTASQKAGYVAAISDKAEMFDIIEHHFESIMQAHKSNDNKTVGFSPDERRLMELYSKLASDVENDPELAAAVKGVRSAAREREEQLLQRTEQAHERAEQEKMQEDQMAREQAERDRKASEQAEEEANRIEQQRQLQAQERERYEQEMSRLEQQEKERQAHDLALREKEKRELEELDRQREQAERELTQAQESADESEYDLDNFMSQLNDLVSEFTEQSQQRMEELQQIYQTRDAELARISREKQEAQSRERERLERISEKRRQAVEEKRREYEELKQEQERERIAIEKGRRERERQIRVEQEELARERQERKQAALESERKRREKLARLENEQARSRAESDRERADRMERERDEARAREEKLRRQRENELAEKKNAQCTFSGNETSTWTDYLFLGSTDTHLIHIRNVSNKKLKMKQIVVYNCKDVDFVACGSHTGDVEGGIAPPGYEWELSVGCALDTEKCSFDYKYYYDVVSCN